MVSWGAVRSKIVLTVHEPKSTTQMLGMKKGEVDGSTQCTSFFFLFFSFFHWIHPPLFIFPASSQSPHAFRKIDAAKNIKEPISRYVRLHRMNKFCPDHPWQRRTLDKRSDFRDACFWREVFQGGLVSRAVSTVPAVEGKYRRWYCSRLIG